MDLIKGIVILCLTVACGFSLYVIGNKLFKQKITKVKRECCYYGQKEAQKYFVIIDKIKASQNRIEKLR